MSIHLDTIVIGAGQAGLATSYHLRRAGVSHVVLERGRIGDTWRNQRWDSFHLNTPRWESALPGLEMSGDVSAFAGVEEWIAFLERYVRTFALPIRDCAPVVRVCRESEGFRVFADREYRADQVVVASGIMNDAHVPDMACHLPSSVVSLHAGQYRNPTDLAEGAVLIVGSGQSGCQIAEDLREAGRRVYLATSKVGRIPRRYRGRDITEWWRDMGFLDTPVDSLEDPSVKTMAQPTVSGTHGGHMLSLQSLARDGVQLLGRVTDVDGDILHLRPHVRDVADHADEMCDTFRAAVDTYIEEHDIDAPAPTPDPNEPEMPDLGTTDEWTQLSLTEFGINTVIWCTGFRGDFSWLDVDVLDDEGRPRHTHGVTPVPGLYVVGFPWLSKRKSGIIHGVDEDAERIAGQVVSRRAIADVRPEYSAARHLTTS